MAIYSVIGEKEKSFGSLPLSPLISIHPFVLIQSESKRIEVFSSIYVSNDFERRRVSPLPLLDFYRFEARYPFWVGGNRRARDNGVSEKRGSLPGGCRAAVCREKVWRRGRRREGDGLSRAESEGHGGGGLGRAISIVDREHRSRPPI